jgi:DNA polymerase III subunit beta
VLIRLKDSQATFVAADGFRMAVRTLPLATAVTEPLEVVVPASSLRELGRLLSDVTDTVAMTIAPTQGHVRPYAAIDLSACGSSSNQLPPPQKPRIR